jgi:hypothetical protein
MTPETRNLDKRREKNESKTFIHIHDGIGGGNRSVICRMYSTK